MLFRKIFTNSRANLLKAVEPCSYEIYQRGRTSIYLICQALKNNCKKSLAKIICGNRCSREIKRSAHTSTVSPPLPQMKEQYIGVAASSDPYFPWQISPAAEAQPGSLIDLVGILGIPVTWKWILVWGFVSRQTAVEGINSSMMGTAQ